MDEPIPLRVQLNLLDNREQLAADLWQRYASGHHFAGLRDNFTQYISFTRLIVNISDGDTTV